MTAEKEMFGTSSSQWLLVARGAEGLRWQPSILMANSFRKSCFILFRSFPTKTLGGTKFVGPPFWKNNRGCRCVCQRTVEPELRNLRRKAAENAKHSLDVLGQGRDSTFHLGALGCSCAERWSLSSPASVINAWHRALAPEATERAGHFQCCSHIARNRYIRGGQLLLAAASIWSVQKWCSKWCAPTDCVFQWILHTLLTGLELWQLQLQGGFEPLAPINSHRTLWIRDCGSRSSLQFTGATLAISISNWSSLLGQAALCQDSDCKARDCFKWVSNFRDGGHSRTTRHTSFVERAWSEIAVRLS